MKIKKQKRTKQKRTTLSAEAFRILQNSGRLSIRHWQVYEYLYKSGPLTGTELTYWSQITGAWKRLSELCDRGYVKMVGLRECRRTFHSSKSWDVTKKR